MHCTGPLDHSPSSDIRTAQPTKTIFVTYKGHLAGISIKTPAALTFSPARAAMFMGFLNSKTISYLDV
jgi:hypothetical protein